MRVLECRGDESDDIAFGDICVRILGRVCSFGVKRRCKGANQTEPCCRHRNVQWQVREPERGQIYPKSVQDGVLAVQDIRYPIILIPTSGRKAHRRCGYSSSE